MASLAASYIPSTSTIKERATDITTSVTARLWQWLARALDMIRVLVAKYPSMGVLIVSFLGMASIPFGIFLFVTISALVTMATIATVVVGTIEGGLVLVSGFFLLMTLGVNFIGASIVAGGVSLARISSSTLRSIWHRVGLVEKVESYMPQYQAPEPLKQAATELKRSVTTAVTSM